MAQTYKICLLPGDGIGPEIIAEGVKVLDAIAAKYGVSFEYTEALIGGRAIDETGSALPEATLAIASGSDAVLLAAVGGPKWDTTDPSKPRPEQGLPAIRKGLGLYANLRPVVIFNALADASTLKPSVIDGVDCVIVRELTGGLYFGERERTYDVAGAGVNGAPGQQAYDTLMYSEYELERIAMRSRPHANVAVVFTRSTKRTCSKPRACGVRSRIVSPRSIPMSNLSICSLTMPLCS